MLPPFDAELLNVLVLVAVVAPGLAEEACWLVPFEVEEPLVVVAAASVALRLPDDACCALAE